MLPTALPDLCRCQQILAHVGAQCLGADGLV
jgi:hypothetical protein